MTFTEIVKLLLLASIILTVFSLALRARAEDAFYLFREWRLGLRAFASMYVLVPAVAILIAATFALHPPVKIALIALAFSPVPPLLPKKQIKAGGSASYITGLLVAASLVSLIVAPIGLHLAGTFFGVEANVHPATIARVLAVGIGAPLAAGLVGGKLLGEKAHGVSDLLAKIANMLFLLCVFALLVGLAPTIRAVIGDGTIVALLAMIATGLAAGYWLGGNVPGDRTALSLASAARHPGIAIAIAVASFPGAKLAAAAIVLSAILNAIVGMLWLRRLAKVAASAEKAT